MMTPTPVLESTSEEGTTNVFRFDYFSSGIVLKCLDTLSTISSITSAPFVSLDFDLDLKHHLSSSKTHLFLTEI